MQAREAVAKGLCGQVLALNVWIQNGRWSMEDTGPLVDLSALELTDVPITLGATYQYGGRGGGEDTATAGEEGRDVGIVQESRVKATNSLPE